MTAGEFNAPAGATPPSDETDEVTVTASGVWRDMDEAVYHADPVPGGSLSSTGARLLLPPGCPALFRHRQQKGADEQTDEMRRGAAAHRVVLGAGADVAVIEADTWRGKEAKAQREEAVAAGKIPILEEDAVKVQAMAAALTQHPRAAQLLDHDSGQAELSVFWQDVVWRRARMDFVRRLADGRTVIVDYKTCQDADEESVSSSIGRYGYHQQAAWYLRGARAVGLAGPDAVFVFVFQEKKAPYLTTCWQLDGMALSLGAAKNEEAVRVYARCVEEGRWPGHGDDIEVASLPAWRQRQEERRYL